jgi:DNA mismatch repair protein MutL
VCELKKMMAEYITKSLLHFKEKEEIAGPLLISEPFKIPKGKIDSHFENLKDLGFELDRLNNEVIALRTIPRFVPQVLSKEITNILIKYFENPKVKKFDNKIFYSFVEEFWVNKSPLPEYLLTQILQKINPHQSPALLLLSESNIKGFSTWKN